MHPKPKSREMSFARNLLLSLQVVLNLCIEHGSTNAVLRANIQNDLTTEMYVMPERDSAWFDFKMSLGRISWEQQSPREHPRYAGTSSRQTNLSAV